MSVTTTVPTTVLKLVVKPFPLLLFFLCDGATNAFFRSRAVVTYIPMYFNPRHLLVKAGTHRTGATDEKSSAGTWSPILDPPQCVTNALEEAASNSSLDQGLHNSRSTARRTHQCLRTPAAWCQAGTSFPRWPIIRRDGRGER